MKSLHVALLVAAIVVADVNSLQTGSGSAGQTARIHQTRKMSELFADAAVDREPAGVAAMFIGKRQKMKSIAAAVRHRRKKGSHNPVFLQGTDNTKGSLSKIDLPEWASGDVDEKHRLAQMKSMLKDDLADLAKKFVRIEGVGTKSVLEAFPDVYSDFRLLRFLRKDKLQDPSGAADRFRNFIQWREKNDIDTLRRLVEETPFGPPVSLRFVDTFIPCDFCEDQSPTSEAAPMLLHVGDWDTSGIAAQIESGGQSMDSFLMYWAYMFESLTKRLHEDSMNCKTMMRTNQICDLTELNLKQFSPSFVSRIMKPWLSLTQSNYPETAKTITFIRPPRIISFVWNLVTPFVSPGTVAKVQMNRKFRGTCEEFISTELAQT